MQATDAIRVDGLEKQYPKGPRALDGISFTVAPGEIFGLLGPNGAGKSTTVKILTTLASPSGGRAEVAGLDVVRERTAVRRRIGYVAQGSGVDRYATGRENLELVAHLQGLEGRPVRTRVAELLDRFGLADAADRKVTEYSGGMQRRLDVAIGLVHRPQVLFLDEPTTGLDPEHRRAMWEEVEGLAAGEELTILLTTHYLEEADHLAARLAILDAGRIVAEGSPEGLKADLAGDTVELGFADEAAAEAASASAAELPLVHETLRHGRSVRVRVDHGARAVPELVTAMEAAGLAVDTVTVQRPSLDDVYLRHAGRTFAEAEAG